MRVFDEAGRWCTEENEIAEVAETYFKNLFTTAHTDDANMEDVLESVDRRVTADMNQILLRNYIAGEVKLALF